MSEPLVIITGAGRGIGRAIALRFAAERYLVVAVARNSNQLAETAAQVEAAAGRCYTHVADVSSAAEVEQVVDSALQWHGRIDVLVNNAGLAPLATAATMPLDVYQQCNGVNIDAVFYACRAVWDTMRRQGGGTIVNISSLSAVDPFPGLGTYGAAKAWVVAFTRSLAEEGRADNIRVLGVGPGAVDTQMLRGPFPDLPAERCLRPQDVAETVYQMTMPAYRYATGQTLYICK